MIDTLVFIYVQSSCKGLCPIKSFKEALKEGAYNKICKKIMAKVCHSQNISCCLKYHQNTKLTHYFTAFSF